MGESTARGVGLLVARTLILQLLTAGVTIVIARLLTPADYGLFAIALAVQLASQHLAQAGLHAALIRMREVPSEKTQAASTGFMLVAGLALSGPVILGALVILPALGHEIPVLQIVAVTMVSVPFYSLRSVPVALMDRGMRFGRVAAVEAVETLGFNAFALVAAIAGLGAFSLAGGMPFGALLATATAWKLQPAARSITLSFKTVKPMLGFGSRVGILGMLVLGREVGFVTLVGSFGGATMAGYFGMAKRLFSFSTAMSAAVSRVAFPALSKSDDDREHKTASIISQLGVASSLPLALIAGSAEPLVGVVLGAQWLPTADVILAGALAMLIGPSFGSAVNSFLFAEGRPNASLAATIASAAVTFGIVIAFVDASAPLAVGVALTAGSLTSASIQFIAAPPLVRTATRGTFKVAAATGLAIVISRKLPVDNDLQGLLATLATSGTAWTLATAALLPAELKDVATMIVRLLRSLLPKGG